jgi:hypothetical protein
MQLTALLYNQRLTGHRVGSVVGQRGCTHKGVPPKRRTRYRPSQMKHAELKNCRFLLPWPPHFRRAQ